MITLISLSNQSENSLKFCWWLKTDDAPQDNATNLYFLGCMGSDGIKLDSSMLKFVNIATKSFSETIVKDVWTLNLHLFNYIQTLYDKKLLVLVQSYTPLEFKMLHFAARWALASRLEGRKAMIKFPGQRKNYGKEIYGCQFSSKGINNQTKRSMST